MLHADFARFSFQCRRRESFLRVLVRLTAAAPARRISPILRFRLPFYGLSLLEIAPFVTLVTLYEKEATDREYEIRP